MSSSGGLSRRRVGGGGGGSGSGDNNGTTSYDDDNNHNNNGHLPQQQQNPSRSNSPPLPSHHHAGSAFEGGNKIAFDPRDLQQDASEEARTGGKMPRLTIMEEVLLLGIKDKQVRNPPSLVVMIPFCPPYTPDHVNSVCHGFLSLSLIPQLGFYISILIPKNIGLSLILERQHLLRSPWLHSYRTSSPPTHSLGQRCQSSTNTHIRSYHPSHR